MLGRRAPEPEAYAVERCGSCGREERRRFRAGDCVLAGAPACGACGGAATIDRIFGEATGRR